jgi:hypothetical protein
MLASSSIFAVDLPDLKPEELCSTIHAELEEVIKSVSNKPPLEQARKLGALYYMVFLHEDRKNDRKFIINKE